MLVRMIVVGAVLLTACGGGDTDVAPSPATTVSTTAAVTTTTTVPATVSTTTAVTTTTASPYSRPDWLGTRVLPLRPDGEIAVAQPTPPELQDRQFETIDYLPPPPDDLFVSTIAPVPDDVIKRSTWVEECPVTRDELAYITVSHYGFDHQFHTGELIVDAAVAGDIVSVFAKLHAARFPIEQMRVSTAEDLDAPPTGDGNVTGAFVCRPTTGGQTWSQHAYGRAIDVNPFHNPYVKGEVIIPELASSYADRDRELAGMISGGDVVTEAFRDIGWVWGGDWNTLKDWMHFSMNGR